MNRNGSMYGNGRNIRDGQMNCGPQRSRGGQMERGSQGSCGGQIEHGPQGSRGGQMERGSQGSCGSPMDYAPQGACGCQTNYGTQDAYDGTSGTGAACGCMDIPQGNQQQLLSYIDEVSFCAYDLMLYLDSHPEDDEARKHFHKYNDSRDRALQMYEESYGPLRFSQTGRCRLGSVKWVNQAWPWEGGEC